LNGEVLNLSTQLTKLSIETRHVEDKVMQRVNKELLEARLNQSIQAKESEASKHFKKLQTYGLKTDDYQQFRDSLQTIVFEGNTQALVN
jgi:hypothetical protein